MAKVKIDSSSVRGLADKLKETRELLTVGWFEGTDYDDGVPVAGVAAANEFGTKTAPARPFFRPAIVENRKKWIDTYKSMVMQWIYGQMSYSGALTAVGLVVEADIKNSIISGNHLPLSPITLALRRLRNDNVPISKQTIGWVAAAVAAGKTGSGELGRPSDNRDPLRETGYMIATLTHNVGGYE